MKTETCKLYFESLLNLSARCHQNQSFEQLNFYSYRPTVSKLVRF